ITPAGSAYTVLVNGSARTVNAVSVASSTTVVLTLASRVYGNDTVTVAYTQPASNKLQDNAANLAATFTAQSVTNTATAALAQSTLAASPTSITANGTATT